VTRSDIIYNRKFPNTQWQKLIQVSDT
jgi:hypothetical protein